MRSSSHAALAVFLHLFFILVACIGWWWLVLSYCTLPLVLGYLHFRWYEAKIRTNFFVAWSLTSIVLLIGVFQLQVVPYLEILFIENFSLMALVSAACLCAFWIRQDPGILQQNSLGTCADSDSLTIKIQTEPKERIAKCAVCEIPMPPRSSHCLLCRCCIRRRDHHCIWLGVCIGAKNHKTFICGLTFLCMALFYGANLTLTTICHPIEFWGLFLVPENCADVYDDIYIALPFVCAAYALCVGVLVLIVLGQQLMLIAMNTTMYELQKQRQFSAGASRGIWRNCWTFWMTEA